MNYLKFVSITLLLTSILFITCTQKDESVFRADNLYPWCIVAFDSLERSPADRIQMLKELGFTKYAYDWRDHHLKDTETELKLAQENNIELISVWLWLNAKRDSIGKLSPGNEKMLNIIEGLDIKTTFWVSFSENFFKDKTQEESIETASEMITYIHDKADEFGCEVALYNHRGWFGNPHNQVEIINRLPQLNLSMVYNFHHAHGYYDVFPEIAKKIKPYLAAVNINGMRIDGPKILPVGSGDKEAHMIEVLVKEGFVGPWGVLGHVEDADVKDILEKNLAGIKSLDIEF